MPKIKINTIIRNEDNIEKTSTNAIIQDNKIKYKEKNNTTTSYDYINNVLIRDNNQINMYYKFDLDKETEGIIKIKELNKEINLKIKTNKIIINNNNIEIEYKIEKDLFIYKIEEIN